ncbi:GNAT family N-acetyltransferase [Rhodovulum sp. DZ06]|uniref:GNAT family N-acetyltransferase n=1 Tax=Rhodovulum sp. DZ06 TaxID=3425126 RepID=UPI003D352029
MKITWRPGAAAPGGAALQQHPAYAAALAALGREARVALFPSGARALTLQRPLGRLGGAALTSRADIAAEEMAALHRALPFGPLRALIATPDTAQELGAAGFAPVRTPLHLAELDLARPELLRRAAAAQKWRNRLRKAEAEPLKIRRRALPPDPAHPALIEEALQRRARGYKGLPPRFAAAFASANPGGAMLFEALHRGAPVAHMLFLLHAPGATWFLGWSGPEGRARNAHNLLLWRAAEWLADQGCTTLDLGPVDTETHPDLARFKLGSGAAPRPLGATWIRAPGSALFAPRAHQRRSTLVAS